MKTIQHNALIQHLGNTYRYHKNGTGLPLPQKFLYATGLKTTKDYLHDFLSLKYGIAVIRGGTGTGKTTLLQSIVDYKVAEGKKVLVINTEHNEIKNVPSYNYLNISTRYVLKDQNGQEPVKNVTEMMRIISEEKPDVVVIDDFSQLPSKDLAIMLANSDCLVVISVSADSPSSYKRAMDEFANNMDFLERLADPDLGLTWGSKSVSGPESWDDNYGHLTTGMVSIGYRNSDEDAELMDSNSSPVRLSIPRYTAF